MALVDAVVDDRDLHAFAAGTGGRGERRSADEGGALVERQPEPHARVEPVDERKAGEVDQPPGRELDGQAVQHDLVAARDVRGGDRPLQLNDGRSLGALEAREVAARGRARDVEPVSAGACERPALGAGKRREWKADDHAHSAVCLARRNAQGAVAEKRERAVSEVAIDRLEARGCGCAERERRDRGDEEGGAAQGLRLALETPTQ